MNPADGDRLSFAVRRGWLSVRFDAPYNFPKYRVLEKHLLESRLGACRLDDSRVVKAIVEGRITPKADCYSDEPDAPVFLRAQNIQEGYLNFEDAKRLLPEAFEAETKAILRDGDIVLTIDGVLLGVAAVHRSTDVPCCISNHMVRIVHGPEIDPEYLAWFLNSPAGQWQIKREVTGSAIPGLRTDAIERILVPLPPLDKQRAVVAEIETARGAQQAKLAQADALLAGMDEYMLEQLGLKTPNRESRTAFAVRLAQLRGTRLDALSARSSRSFDDLAIHTRPLGNIAEIDQNNVVRPEKSDSLVPYVGLPECDLTSVREVVTRPYSEVKGRSIVRRGDILFARIEPSIFNRKYVLAEDLSGHDYAFTSTEFYVVRAKPEIVSQEFLYAMFFCSFVYEQAVGKTTGSSGRRRLDRDAFTQLQIPLPKPDEQKKIAVEVARRHETARRLRAEAAAEWEAAKARFEEQLLGAGA